MENSCQGYDEETDWTLYRRAVTKTTLSFSLRTMDISCTLEKGRWLDPYDELVIWLFSLRRDSSRTWTKWRRSSGEILRRCCRANNDVKNRWKRWSSWTTTSVSARDGTRRVTVTWTRWECRTSFCCRSTTSADTCQCAESWTTEFPIHCSFSLLVREMQTRTTVIRSNEPPWLTHSDVSQLSCTFRRIFIHLFQPIIFFAFVLTTFLACSQSSTQIFLFCSCSIFLSFPQAGLVTRWFARQVHAPSWDIWQIFTSWNWRLSRSLLVRSSLISFLPLEFLQSVHLETSAF